MTEAEILKCLQESPHFRSLPEAALRDMAAVLEEEPLAHSPGTAVINQGEVGQDFFIICRGQAVEEGADPVGRSIPLRVLGKGDFFGHFPLIRGVQRATSVVVGRERLSLLKLKKKDFLRLVSQYPQLADLVNQRIAEDILNRIKSLSFFSLFPPQELKSVAGKLHIESRQVGDVLFREGDASKTLYVISAGKIHVRRTARPTVDAIFSTGNFFGERAALDNTPRSATATVVEGATLVAIDESVLGELARKHSELESVLRRKDILERLRAVPLFKNLSSEERETIAWNVGRVGFPKGQYVCHQGEPGSRYYILEKGEIEIRNLDKQGKRLSEEGGSQGPPYAFDERALLFGQPYRASVWAKEDCQFLFIDKSDFDYIRQHKRNIEKGLNPEPETKQMLRYGSFKWQTEGEIVVYYSYRHWSAFLRGLVSPFSLVLASLQAGPKQLRAHHQLTTIVEALVSLGMIAGIGFLLEWPIWYITTWGGLTFLWVAWNWVEWHNDYFAITTKRVIRSERVILGLTMEEKTAELDKIQNTKVSISLIGNLLGFCDLTIETAATAGTVKFEHIPRYPDAEKILHEQVAAQKVGAQLGQKQQIRQVLRVEIGKHDPWEVAEVASPTPSSSFWASYGKRLQSFLDTVLPWRERGVDRKRGDIAWRKHRLNLLQRAWLPALLFSVMNVVLLLSLLRLPPLDGVDFPIWLIALLVNIPIGFWLWWEVTDWSNDLYIITPTHVVDVEKKPLFFAESRVQAELEAIQNVSFEQRGLLNSLFDMGDVVIETAAKAGKLTFTRVDNPREVQREIFKSVEKRRQQKAQEEAKRRQKEFSEWFDVYHETFVDLEG